MLGTIGSIIDSEFLSEQYLPHGDEIISISGSHIGFVRVVEIAVQTDDIQAVVGNVHHSVSRDKQRPDGFRKPEW